jgi:hypothetical protein
VAYWTREMTRLPSSGARLTTTVNASPYFLTFIPSTATRGASGDTDDTMIDIPGRSSQNNRPNGAICDSAASFFVLAC